MSDNILVPSEVKNELRTDWKSKRYQMFTGLNFWSLCNNSGFYSELKLNIINEDITK